jgi:O-antigen/teichoic acid export membrane protein
MCAADAARRNRPPVSTPGDEPAGVPVADRLDVAAERLAESGSWARRAGDALIWKAVQLLGTKGIFLVRTLILARLLSPEDFGLFAIAVLGVYVLMTTTELGIVPALVHRPEVAEAQYDAAWTAGVVRALGVSGLLMVAAPAVASLFGEPRAAALLRVLAVKPLIDSCASIRIAELTRKLKYRRLALLTLTSVAIETAVSIALATTYGVWALIAGALAGGCSGVVLSYVLAPHRPRAVVDGHAIRPLIHYGRWILLSGLVAITATSLTQVVISRQLGAFELGLYFLASKLAFLPYEVASQVVGDVAFPLYARIQGDAPRVARAFRSILVGMVTLLLPLYAFLIGLAPWLVRDVLGDRWLGTEPLIQALAVVGIAGLFGDVCTPLFRGLGHPKWALVADAVPAGLVIALVPAMTERYGAIGAALAWLIAVGVSQPLVFVLARRLVSRPLDAVLLPLTLVLVASSAGAATTIAVSHVVSGVGGLAIAVGLALTVTAALVWVGDRRFELGVMAVLTETFPQVAGAIGLAPRR